MAVSAGTKLGPYEILSAIGAGGMGEVYRARDPRIGRDVAIKVLPREVATDPERLRRFEQEVRAIGTLNHPNLLSLYDVGTSEAGPFLVSELLEGETLRARLAAGPLPLRKTIDWGVQICHGLEAAHERGVVHRDLKPENVFLVGDGRAKILDFGLARIESPFHPGGPDAATAPVAATAAGVTLGTVGYMSPEQVRGEPAGPASDIFALGALLYEMAARRPAFREKTTVETLNAILKDDPPPVPASAALPAAIERVIARCLKKDPSERFRSAQDVAFALEALAPATPRRKTVAPARIRAAMLAGVGALLLIFLALWLPWRVRQVLKPPPSAGPTAALTMTPFLSSPAIEKQPAWSPSGDLLAYVSDAAGNDDIWIVDPSGANPVNLTPSFTGVDNWPAWSADGRSVAFYSERDGGGIYTMTALGASVRRVVSLAPGILYTFSLSWARDGSIVYTGFDPQGTKQVYRVASGGGEPACLTCNAAPLSEGRAGELSPSGGFLAYLSGLVGPRAVLYVKDLSSGQVTEVANRADWPHWSADGRRIIFISARDGQPDLWELEINPRNGSAVGTPHRLTSALGATTFTMAPDSRQVLAVKEQSTNHLWSVPLSAAPVPDLGRSTQLTSGDVRDRRARWSPDGTSVFFESERRGSADIWRLDAGGGVSRLTTASGAEARPRPSPQGDWIALDVLDARGEFTYLMRPDGSQLHPLNQRWFTTYRQVCCGDWSPDGSRLTLVVTGHEANAANDKGMLGVVSIDRVKGTAGDMRLLDLPGWAPQYGRWSPDGRLIVYEAVTEGSWDLWIVNPDHPAPRRLTSFPGNERQAVWQKTPLGILFYRDFREIWRLPLSAEGSPTGPAERWFVPPAPLTLTADSLDVSPSGDRLMVTLVTPASDIWLVELGK
jgi:eukaryotic-like serine/threonine-protein kinase